MKPSTLSLLQRSKRLRKIINMGSSTIDHSQNRRNFYARYLRQRRK